MSPNSGCKEEVAVQAKGFTLNLIENVLISNDHKLWIIEAEKSRVLFTFWHRLVIPLAN